MDEEDFFYPGDQTDALPENYGSGMPNLARPPLCPSAEPVPSERPTRLATHPDSDSYNMNHAQIGTAIIFNNMKFSPTLKGYGERRGSEKDAVNLYNLLTEMGFNTVTRTDLKRDDMLATLRKVANEDHSNADCFVCAILSHGEEGSVYGYDGPIEVNDLVAPLKGKECPTLAGKPKIFLIQACRGSMLDEGQDVEVPDARGVCESDTRGEPMEVDVPVIRRIPTEADFLMAYSSVSGYYAWRNMQEGSWFIQAVCKVFRKNWKRMDLLSMMTRVSRMVAFEFESSHVDKAMSGKKQVPCVTSMLTHDVYFTPKK